MNVQCLGEYATCKEDKGSGNLGHYVKRDSMIYADVLVLLWREVSAGHVTGVDEQEMHVKWWWGDLFENDLLDE